MNVTKFRLAALALVVGGTAMALPPINPELIKQALLRVGPPAPKKQEAETAPPPRMKGIDENDKEVEVLPAPAKEIAPAPREVKPEVAAAPAPRMKKADELEVLPMPREVKEKEKLAELEVLPMPREVKEKEKLAELEIAPMPKEVKPTHWEELWKKAQTLFPPALPKAKPPVAVAPPPRVVAPETLPMPKVEKTAPEIAPPPRVVEKLPAPKIEPVVPPKRYEEPVKPAYQPPKYDPSRQFEPRLPQPEKKESLATITGEEKLADQFLALSDLLDGKNADAIRDRVLKVDSKVNRALLASRNFQILGSSLFANAIERIVLIKGKDGKHRIVVEFKDGSFVDVQNLALTAKELEALLKGSKKDARFDLSAFGGPQEEAFELAAKNDALALLNDFAVTRSKEGRRVLVAGDRRAAAKSESKPISKGSKETHDKR